MLKAISGLLKGLWKLAPMWRVWVGVLIVVNLLLPLLFWGTHEAIWTVIAFAVAALIQVAVFHHLGFVRFLGIGHLVVWVPLLSWLLGRLAVYGVETAFGLWLASVVVLNGISLVIDFVDVARYLSGERMPTIGGRRQHDRG